MFPCTVATEGQVVAARNAENEVASQQEKRDPCVVQVRSPKGDARSKRKKQHRQPIRVFGLRNKNTNQLNTLKTKISVVDSASVTDGASPAVEATVKFKNSKKEKRRWFQRKRKEEEKDNSPVSSASTLKTKRKKPAKLSPQLLKN